jgi:hypothetical protein
MPEIHWGDTRFTECCWYSAQRVPNGRKRAAGLGAHREVRFFSSAALPMHRRCCVACISTVVFLEQKDRKNNEKTMKKQQSMAAWSSIVAKVL